MTTMEFVAAAFAPVKPQASVWRRLVDAIVAERKEFGGGSELGAAVDGDDVGDPALLVRDP